MGIEHVSLWADKLVGIVTFCKFCRSYMSTNAQIILDHVFGSNRTWCGQAVRRLLPSIGAKLTSFNAAEFRRELAAYGSSCQQIFQGLSGQLRAMKAACLAEGPPAKKVYATTTHMIRVGSGHIIGGVVTAAAVAGEAAARNMFAAAAVVVPAAGVPPAEATAPDRLDAVRVAGKGRPPRPAGNVAAMRRIALLQLFSGVPTAAMVLVAQQLWTDGMGSPPQVTSLKAAMCDGIELVLLGLKRLLALTSLFMIGICHDGGDPAGKPLHTIAVNLLFWEQGRPMRAVHITVDAIPHLRAMNSDEMCLATIDSLRRLCVTGPSSTQQVPQQLTRVRFVNSDSAAVALGANQLIAKLLAPYTQVRVHRDAPHTMALLGSKFDAAFTGTVNSLVNPIIAIHGNQGEGSETLCVLMSQLNTDHLEKLMHGGRLVFGPLVPSLPEGVTFSAPVTR